MWPEVQAYTADELRPGLRAEFEREVREEDVLGFAENSGDWNPLHVDPDYARETGFGKRVVHGAFQVGLASALLGVHLPGCRVLLGSISARFPEPLYYPCQVRVRGEITAWNSDALAGMLRVVVEDVTKQIPTAEIAMGFTFHQTEKSPVAAPGSHASNGHASDRPVVLVTGASGGIGSAITASLAGDYRILALTNSQPLADSLRVHDRVRELRGDLADANLADTVATVLGTESLYGIVHAAWPGAPHGGLLDASDELIERQLAFGTTHIIRLARLLAARAASGGGRLVVLGSIAGGQKPTLSLAAYSLAKNAAEQTVRLLAPELARRKITVNVVAPSFVPVGMHQGCSDRQLLRETALVPMGRSCQPQDIVETVRFLLSPQAEFVSGQVIGLTGAQL